MIQHLPYQLYRAGRDRLLAHCLQTLTDQGWKVYKRGFPTVVAEKGCQMRMIVINPLVNLRPVVIGKGKDAMSEAFYRCFGVAYEVWENQKEEEPKGWV